MAKLTKIDNPFDPYNCKTVTTIEAGKPIFASIEAFHCHFDVAVSVNGQIIEDYKYIVQEDDHVGFLAIPQGGGDGKNPFATIALVALTIAAPYAGAFAGIVFSSTVVASIVTAGVLIGGGMLINSLLPPPQPDLGGLSGGLQDSPTYSWGETQNPTYEGTPIPIVYGVAKITPLVISQYVEVYGDKQYLNILYALNDGEIANVTDIEINGSPLSYYDSVTSEIRLGLNTQTLIPSFDNTRIDNAVGVKLNTVETLRTTSNNGVSGLSIVIAANGGLYYANDAGGLSSITVTLEIKYRLSGSGVWTTIPDTAITGATTSTIREVFTVNDLPAGTYDVSVRRTVAESTAVRTHESIYFEALTEIIYDDFTYPNTALLAIRALATDQLSGSTPRVTCVVDRGAGLNNPALAAKNIIQLIGGEVNATKFAEWEAFCNAEGFTCNIVFDSVSNVRDSLNAISLLGRATIVPIGSEYIPIIDKAESLATQRFLFGMGNIIRDSFEENYLPLADRTNVVALSYFDSNLGYERQSVEVYQNGFDESLDIARRASITLYGCTDRDMAIRYARFLLNKNRYLTNTVSFDADIDAIACTIGDVIDVAHDVPQWGFSGRIVDANAPLDSSFWVFETGVYIDGVFYDNTETGVRLDREITLEAGVTYYFTVKFNSDDSRETVEIMSPVTITTDTFAEITGLSKAPEEMMLFSFGTPNREVKQFRVSAITRSSEQRRKITAIEYIPEVYADTGDAIPVINRSLLSSVSALQATNYYRTNINGLSENVVDLTWIGVGIGWNVYHRLQGDVDWIFDGYTTKTSYQLLGVPAGTYEYRVGDKIATTTVADLPDAPSLTNVTASPRYTGVQFELTYAAFPEFSHVEAWEGTLAQTVDDAVLVGTTVSTIYQRYGLPVIASNNYWFRIVDVYGNKGLFHGPTVGTTSTDVGAILLDLAAQQGNSEYLPALSDILIAGNIAGVPSLGLSGDLFVDGTVTANSLAIMGVSTFTNDTGYGLDSDIVIAQDTADSKNSTFTQATAPLSGMVTNDVWYDSDDNYTVYTYDGAAWVNIAPTLPTGGVETFYQPTSPTAINTGDLWFDTDANFTVYRWSGSAWVSVTLDAALAVNNGTTTIDGSNITTGTVTALEIATNTITASEILAGTITSAEVDTLSIQTDVVTATHINTLSITAGSVAAEDITGTTITGKTITGGTLTGNTLNIQDINIKDTASNTIAASFSGSGAITYNSGTYTLTLTTGIRTSGNLPFNLLANNGFVSVNHAITHSLVAPVKAGYTWLCSSDAPSLAVRVYYSTGVAYRSLTLNLATETVFGWTFATVYNTGYSKNYHYYIKNNNVPVDAVSDVDGYVITLDSTSVMDTPLGTNTAVPFSWMVSNI